MKFGAIGAGTVAFAFARQAVATDVVQNLLPARLLSLGTERPRPRSRRPQASTMSCSPFLGRTSRTRYGACQRGTVEYSSTQQIRSSSTAPNSCWPT
jgi:hypothetical protein